MQERIYQKKAVTTVLSHWGRGVKPVILVAPPGSGKTFMGAKLALKFKHVLWVAHRRELVNQAAEQLEEFAGKGNVGRIMAGVGENPGARIQVASVDMLLMRGCPEADLVVLDEAHHYLAETYRTVLELYPKARVLGLSATPWRDSDGQPLAHIFDKMVVAAQMSDLIKAGHLVDADVIRPKEYLGHDLAMDPVTALQKYAPGMSTFAFFPRVETAQSEARRLKARGIRAECIEGRTGVRLRDTYVTLFRSGLLDVLTNVDVLTEGVNITKAEAVLSCRSFRSLSAMLQAFGRALRPAPNKTRALILDLTGATHLHGLPTEDRDYTLDGRVMKSLGAREESPTPRDEFVQEILDADVEAVALSPAKRVFAGLKPIVVPRRESLDHKKMKKLHAKYGKRRVADELARLDRMGA